ncbi:GNAT family N-acetyltransferase family protein [Clostridium novyi]
MGYCFLYKKFKDINLNDHFFDSLKYDYQEFEDWFKRKAEEYAYIQTIDDNIEGFLYLKIEDGPITDVIPSINCSRAVKIGTMKINPHGTRLGERFIKKALDFSIKNNIEYVYVTVFAKHKGLINIYKRYGFEEYAEKSTSNGVEKVLLKDLSKCWKDSILNYPKINLNSNVYLLSIRPEYHTRMFPDSILNNESFDIVEDVSHTNSIDKIYICKMNGVNGLRKNDLILIYRTSDGQGPAAYRSVATSICTVQDVKSSREFKTFDDYKNYCKNYSIFTDKKLKELFNSRYEYFVIKMTYNIALSKKIIRKKLIETIGIRQDEYWGFLNLRKEQLENILQIGQVNPGYIIY